MIKINFKSIHYSVFRKLQGISRLFNNEKLNVTKEIIIYPEIDTNTKLYELNNHLAWYLPFLISINKIYICCSGDISTLKIENILDNRIEIIPKKEAKYKILNNKNTLILINDYKALYDFSLIFRLYRIIIVDKQYFSHVESYNWQSLLFSILHSSKLDEMKRNSINNFNKLCLKYKNYEKAYCFVTGPSFDSYNNYSFDKKAVKIICNSIVKNKDFINYIGKPDILCFADAVFHFGPSQYAKIFRENVLEVVKESRCFILLPDTALPLFYYHYPELRPYLIGIESTYKGDFNFPSIDNLWHFNTGNVLSFLMLPIASTLVDNIFIFGADGREKKETYFWKHSKSAQYDDLMQSVFDMHPSFFNDRNYGDYYDEHCKSLEKLIEFGENKQKRYHTLSKSFIPALAKRYEE
jgi:hypothetical protein